MGRGHHGKKKPFKFTAVPTASKRDQGQASTSTAAAAAAHHSEAPVHTNGHNHTQAHQESCAEFRAHYAAHHSQGNHHGKHSCGQDHNHNHAQEEDGGIDNKGLDFDESDSEDSGPDSNSVALGSDSSSSESEESISKTLRRIFKNKKKYCSPRRTDSDMDVELIGLEWDESKVDFKCDLPTGKHGVLECKNSMICDLCYITCVRNLNQPKRMGGISFKIPGLLEFPIPQDRQGLYEYKFEVNPGPPTEGQAPATEGETPPPTEEDQSFTVTFEIDAAEIRDDGDEESDDDEESEVEEEESSEEDEDGDVECGQDGKCCETHKQTPCSSKACSHQTSGGGGRGEKLLRGMKDWRPAQLNYHDQQYVLRQAKKFKVDATNSKLLQFVLQTLKRATGVEDDGMPSKPIPKFARKKLNKRKLLGRTDFPKYDISDAELENMTRPYAYLELLDHDMDDGILLISLTDMIGISRMRDEMIGVFDKNFGYDYRIELLKEDGKKRHSKSSKK